MTAALHTLWTLLRDTVAAFFDDDVPSLGAALAYYTLFSIAPLLLIVLALAGAVFGDEAARGGLIGELRGLMGDDGARAVEALLASVGRDGNTLPATLGGLGVLLIGATSVFAELQSAMDRIWRVPADLSPLRGRTDETPLRGVWSWLRRRLLSVGLILGIGFLLMVSLVGSAALAAASRWWMPLLGSAELLAHAVDVVLSLGVTTLAFAMIFKWMPRVQLQWRDVWIGGAATALLFTIGKLLIGTYLGRSGMTSAFGAAASLMAMVVWVYYSAQIFLLGVEFTWVWAGRFGSRREAQLAAAGTPPAETAAPAPRAASLVARRPSP
jgi:membrane protein